MLHGTAPLKLHWDLFLMLFVFYNSISVPFLAAFDQHGGLLALEVIEYFIDVCFAVDILLSFRTSYLDHSGDEVVEPRLIAKQYGCSYKFPLDFVSVIPIETILVSDRQYHALEGEINAKTLKLLSLIKLKRMVRLRRILAVLKYKTSIKLGMRFLLLIFTLFLFAHLSGCFWFLIVSESGTWIAPKDAGQDVDLLYSASIWKQYATSLYCMTVLLLGLDARPSSNGETVYCIFVAFLGSVGIAALFGQMKVLVKSLNSKSATFHEALDTVNQVMTSIQVPAVLQKTVVTYVTQTYWRKDQQEELQRFFGHLSPSLKSEVCTQLFREALVRNTCLGTNDTVDFLMRRLHAKMCKPEDVLLYLDDVSSEMYVLLQGQASVLALDKEGCEQHTRHLNSADYFGEIALLMGCKRTATIIASNFCTFAELNRSNFEELTQTFPYVKTRMLSIICERYQDEWKQSATRALRQLPYFSRCSQQELSHVFYSMQTARYEAGYLLKEPDDPVEHLYLIGTGEVTLAVRRKNGEEAVVHRLGPGGVLFVSSVVNEKKQMFVVRIGVSTCLLSLSEAKLAGNSHAALANTYQNIKAALTDFVSPHDFHPLPPLFQSVSLRFMQEAYRRKLQSPSGRVAGLLTAFQNIASTYKSGDTHEETLDTLLEQALDLTNRLVGTVNRVVADIKER